MKTLLISIIAVLILSILSTIWFTRDRVTLRTKDKTQTITALTVDFANIYIVERDNKIIMIDSGNPGHEARIEALMKEEGINPNTIDYLILTHGHLDHSGTAAYFQRQYGIKLIGHNGDNASFSLGERDDTCPTSLLPKVLKSIKKNVKIPTFNVDILIDKEYDLAQLGIDGKILPWPGHTEGSIIIQLDDSVFVGDLIAGEIFSPETPQVHFFMCDLDDNRKKIQSLLNFTNIKTWYLGHFGPLSPASVRSFVETH